MKKKRPSYIIVLDHDPHKFTKMIDDMLSKGWKLQGGISISHATIGMVMFAQALTKSI